MKTFTEFLTETPLPIDWDKDFFNSQTSHTKLIKYATERAQKVGAGSSRVVFYVHDPEYGDTVLKIAKNKKGLAQNTFEYEIASGSYNSITPELFDYDKESKFIKNNDEFLWLQFDRCKKLTKKYFADKIGVSFDMYTQWIENTGQIMHGGWERVGIKYPKVIIDSEVEDKLENNEFTSNVMRTMSDYEIPFGDLTRLSSYGIDRHGDIKLVDSGLSHDIWLNFYK